MFPLFPLFEGFHCRVAAERGYKPAMIEKVPIFGIPESQTASSLLAGVRCSQGHEISLSYAQVKDWTDSYHSKKQAFSMKCPQCGETVKTAIIRIIGGVPALDTRMIEFEYVLAGKMSGSVLLERGNSCKEACLNYSVSEKNRGEG